MKQTIFTLLFILCCNFWGSAQKLEIYKQVDTTKLYLEIYAPKNLDAGKKYPALVFFFGGGWSGGDRHHFINHAKYFSQRGIICFLADYRIKQKHQTTPFEALKDAKSAMRFVRKNAVQFHIHPEKIIASGGSAGGHLAAATALTDSFNDENDDTDVSCVPNALVLYNPVVDNSPGGYGFERVGKEYHNFSPLHNIKKGAPPTIIFLGTKDKLIPVEMVEYYRVAMERIGSVCELKLYENQGHGFFNYRNFEYYKATIFETDKFLQKLGYLNEEPKIEIK